MKGTNHSTQFYFWKNNSFNKFFAEISYYLVLVVLLLITFGEFRRIVVVQDISDYDI